MDTVDLSISPSDLRARLGRPDAPLVLDVRRTARFQQSDRIVAGARHCAPEQLPAFAAAERSRETVVYCMYGHEVGRTAAEQLRAAGWPARYLQGGIEGGQDGVDAPADIARWRAAPPPLVRKRPDLGVTGEAPSRWITRARPKIDRIACPWLVRRFIDPRAEFFYVPAERVFDEAQRLNAAPFDIAGAPIGHEWERCSFDALIAAFDLRDPALAVLAAIVRGADTDRLAIAPQSAGLLAVSLGLSALHPEDDQAMLRAGLPVYDALYAWCATVRGERHVWQSHDVGTAAVQGAAA